MRVLATKPAADGKGFVKLGYTENGVEVEVEAWTPELGKVIALGAGPVPSEWILRDGPRGKQLLPPKQGRGGSYSQSKEAFERSAASRREWQELEEERKDRRTALMTACELPMVREAGDPLKMALRLSEGLYRWLRESAGGRGAGPERKPDPPSPAEPIDREGVEIGEGSHSPGRSPSLDCDHRFSSGREARVIKHGTEVCARCGMPWVSIVEGTTEDLGAAE